MSSSSSKIIWDDYSDYSDTNDDPESGSSSPGEQQDIEDLKLTFGDINFEEFVAITEREAKECLCYTVLNVSNSVNLLNEMLKWEPTLKHLNCIIDNIIRSFNTIDFESEKVNSYTLAFSDIFFRLRHEMLAKLLIQSLNLPSSNTDKKFSDFGINSNRTPDYIIKTENTLVIIEVSVTSNFEKAAQLKGIEELGFESKYKKELDIISDLGIQHIYSPVIFDMSNMNNSSYKDIITKLGKYFQINQQSVNCLDSYYKELYFLTNNMKVHLAPSATVLFSNIMEIVQDHDELSFLYEPKEFVCDVKYKEIKVTPQVYNKINNIWDNIPAIFESNEINIEDRFSLIMDVKDFRLNFDFHNSGPSLKQYIDEYDKGNKIFFFKNLNLKIGNSIKKCTDSENGVTFIEKIQSATVFNKVLNKIALIVNHSPILNIEDSLDMSRYEIKSRLHSQYKYSPKYYDKDYEDLIFKKILDMDKRRSIGLNPNEYDVNLGLDLLAENRIESISIKGLMNDVKNKMVDLNRFDDSIPLKVKKISQPFLLPLGKFSTHNYTQLSFKNVEFIETLMSELFITGPFTYLLLGKVLDDDYKFYEESKIPSDELNAMYKEKSELARKITLIYKDNARGLTFDNLKRLKINDPEYELLRSQISKLSKRILDKEKSEKIKKNVNFIRLPSKNKKTVLGGKFDQEMKHFNNKNNKSQSVISGLGIMDSVDDDYKKSKAVVEDLLNSLSEYRGVNPDILIDYSVKEESNLLTQLKKRAIDDYQCLIEDIKNSELGHSCSFVSRFAHSLLYYSQMPFNSDYIRVDNLGYKDVLLIVRGGKKIFKSKSSKLYRLVYPINESLIDWYSSKGQHTSSTQIFKFGNSHYLITPWQLMHETILNDSISFYSRVVSFAALNLNPTIKFDRQFGKIALNLLLAFHNRRKTEVFLSNMRYILLSTMGEFTGIQKIFDEFIGFNYDYFQSYLRSCIIFNYPDYFNKFLKIGKAENKGMSREFQKSGLNNLFTGSKIQDENDLALMIYSTFLMSKAPYQKFVERASNLFSILQIHEQFDSEVGLDLSPCDQHNKLNINLDNSQDYENYAEELFKCDFNFDAKYCSNLGVYCNSIFTNKGILGKIETEWISILNRPWDEMATSTGLRGDPDDIESFWGQKGYFVVYRKVLEREDFCDNLDLILSDKDLTDDEKRKIMRNLNKTQIENMYDISKKDLVFHVVDKVQWRGSREIYVMDINTKSMQQPIEQFMAFLCKNLDNELISIPSNKRSQTIHHNIFEKDIPLNTLKTYYLTLDCSKWAPKSTFIKFCHTILSMNCLPSSFKTHFLNYINKLFHKRIYFNNGESNVILKNDSKNSLAKKFLIKDDKLNGYFIRMPYSWVMGIFNYTSSFLHAVNQLYASYIINRTNLISFKSDSSLVMFAHSDDSGGRISAQTKSLIRRGLMLYEINLKCCNHILSKKKSVVSRMYFEILSVIYLFKKLLALLPKFLGGLRFLPTDKGVCQDMMQSYSKCIEVIIAGASFDVAYLVMKIYSMMVWRFYMTRRPITADYDRPVQFLGLPDSHPIMVLLTGSSSDICRIINDKGSEYLSKLLSFSNKIIDPSDEIGPIRPYKFKIQIRNVETKFTNQINRYSNTLSDWTVKNVNFKCTPFNLLNFLSKLTDPGFLGSMVNESLTRRMSRAYFFRNSETLITKTVNINFKKMITLFESFNSIIKGTELGDLLLNEFYIDHNEFIEDLENSLVSSRLQIDVLKNVMSGPLKVLKYMDKINLDGKDIIEVNRTIKPTHLQIIKTGKSFSVDFDPAQLVSFCKNSKFKWALPGIKKMNTAMSELSLLCDSLGFNIKDLDENTLHLLCSNYTNKDVRDVHLYSQIPSDLRVIKTYTGILSFIATNSIKGKEISGIVLSLGKNLSDPSYVNTQVSESVYNLNTVLNLLIILFKYMSLDEFSKMRIKNIESIEWTGGDIKKFLKWISDLRYSEIDYILISVLCEYLLNCKRVGSTIVAPGIILKNSCFYTFLKPQKSRNIWMGKGELMVNIGEEYFIFILLNEKVIEVYTNTIGKINNQSACYIMDTFLHNGIKFNKNYLQSIGEIKSEFIFGFDHSGELSNSQRREMMLGVPSYKSIGDIHFLRNLDVYTLRYIQENLFLLESEDDSLKSFKIYTLRPTISGLIEITNEIFYREDFEEVLLKQGLDNISEFMYNEVLPDFGLELSIKKSDLYENFYSSEIQRVIYTVFESDKDYIPAKIQKVTVPSPVGSLSRLLFKFEEITGERILNSLKNINPDILRLRNEYPESFSLILSEKMNENFKNIYNTTEQSMIQEQYLMSSDFEDFDNLRSKIINLMCYWGYSSLVNVVMNFNFYKEKKNYLIFIYKTANDPKLGEFFSNLFNSLVKPLFTAISSFGTMIKFLDFPVEMFKVNDLNELFISYLFGIAYDCYNFEVAYINISLVRLKFNNLLCALLKEEEFCISLENAFRNISILNTLPINYQNRGRIIAIINLLTLNYNSNKNFQVNLDSSKLRQILDNAPQPKKLVDEFKYVHTSPTMIYHHGLFNRGELDYLTNNYRLRLDTTSFIIKTLFADFSEIKIPNLLYKEIKRPLADDYLEGDIWEEVNLLSQTGDFDEEELLEILEEDPLRYNKPETKKMRGKGSFATIFADIKVIIKPLSIHQNIYKNIRQVGENVVVISPVFINNFNTLYNNHTRIINVDGKELVAHITCNKFLSLEFWDKFLGGENISINEGVINSLYHSHFIDTDNEVKKIDDIGTDFISLMGVSGQQLDTLDDLNDMVIEDKEESGNLESDDIEEPVILGVNVRLKEALLKAKFEGYIDEDAFVMIENKFKALQETNAEISSEYYFKQLLAEINISELKKMVDGGIFDILNKDDKVKIFQAPSYFGLARQGAQINKNFYKNKKIKAEMISINKNLTNASVSGSLTISTEMKRLARSSFKLWSNVLRGDRFKIENKKFLLAIFLLIINDAHDSVENDFDDDWQVYFNDISNFIADSDSEDEDDSLDSFIPHKAPISRIRYDIRGLH